MPSVSKTVLLATLRFLATSARWAEPMALRSVVRQAYRGANHAQQHHLDMLARLIRDHADGATLSMAENGEIDLISRATQAGLRTYIDVGANVGNWACAVLDAHPDNHVFCFEIFYKTRKALIERLSQYGSRAIVAPYGLDQKDGTVTIFPVSNHLLTSTYAPRNVAVDPMEVTVRSGATALTDHNLSSVDMLKIDVEGSEMRVVDGFDGLLRQKKIRLVQFEYNKSSITSRTFLFDFFEKFERYGYILGRLRKNGVLFHNYDVEYEDFNGPNYVACRQDDEALIRRIRAVS